MKKKKIILAATSALAILTLAACSGGGDTNKDIVTMKGGTITVADFYEKAKSESANQQLLQQMVIYDVFNSKYNDKVSDKEVDAEYNKTKETYGDSFETQLESAGYTEESFKEFLRNNLVFKAGIESHVKLTDEDLKKTWETFHPEVEAQIIKVASEDEAKEVKKSADDGKDFEELAKEKSTDTTKDDGGNIKFDSETQTVPSEVKEAAFKLKDGEISDVITATNPSTYATEYYVVKMVKNQDKGNDMDKFKDQLEEIATQAKVNDSEFQTKVIGEELKEANVKIKDDAFQNILTPFTSATTSTSSTEDSATESSETKSSETKSTDSTEASETEQSTTESTNE
ncbi:peptidylprolyl isomerase [Enterococcus mundtii]|uniref:Foldase protein PrsA n=1 Tax=Enterococcus mundtii TaxID=53346 RepID=A0AAI8WDG5_ENTMU|nr:peptidylprolyl isomerase [Enterococcus mundtii]MBE9910250.1 peptidylprolyl isomerase [Enterococcus mundtii]MCA6773864.1 peptidylprolyl isomerase [Enterococcus mundtii]QCJ57501.1 peptidylprolyl isomerase [Enterococcus mundtii]UBM04944.1 peptidylprolyl isomerase [Enterococcus mundtii]BAO08193.1 peptidyl-prolyl isomerase [Enterococcus mundtii QU 25]